MSGSLLAALVLAGTARAQALPWQFVPGAVLGPNPAIPYMGSTVSSPAVVYDSNRGRMIMFFETRTPTVDPSCPGGVWGIGQATSTDGVTWTPRIVPALVPVPGSGTYYQCVAAHPTALYAPTIAGVINGVATIWFKAEQGTVSCAPGPAWGCDQVTGIGKVRVAYNAAGTPITNSVHAVPVWDSPDGLAVGYPKVTRAGGQFRMLVQVYPDIWEGTSVGGNSFSPSLALSLVDLQALFPYADNELFNPSSVCNDDPTYPNAMFVGARDTRHGAVVEGGWSKAFLDPAVGWVAEADIQQSWANDQEWRHWDVHKLSTGPDQYVVWFDEKDAATGDNIIRFGGTDLTITGADLVSKTCP
jgi:hypothetical protein